MTPEIKQRIQQIKQGKTLFKEEIVKNLGELGFVSRGRSKHRPRDASHLYGGEYPFVQTGDIKNAKLYLFDYNQTYSDAGLAQSKLWPKGTLCITIAANIAETAILGIDACFPDSVIGFIPNKELVDVRYLKYLFDLQLKLQFQKYSQGVAQDNLSQEKLLSLKFRIPPLTEQTAIAEILSTQDRVIELKEQLLAEKKRQKKYLMQQLLTGKMRLNGFKGEWKKCRLGEVANRITRKNIEHNSNTLTISAQYGLINQESFFNKIVASDDKSNYYLIQRNEFAYNKSYSSGYPFGAIKMLRNYDKGIVSPLYICFCIKHNYANIDFMEQYFEAGLMNNEIQSFAQEGARNHGLLNISTSDFFNSSTILPPLPEQTAIAEILSTADREIELIGQSIEAEKRKKKSLMQLLLTGIVRVP